MSILEIHSRLGSTATLFSVILALWAFWRYFRREGVDSNYWGTLVIAEILFVVQALVGAYVLFANIAPLTRQFMHILYGIVTVLVVPAVFFFTRGDDTRRTSLIYGAAFLFLVGIFMRASATGL